MSATFTFDARSFNAGVRDKLRVSKRTEAEVLNQAGRNVCLRAIQFTPKAKSAGLGQELLTDGYLMRLVYAIYHPVGGQKKPSARVPGLATGIASRGATRVPGYTREQMQDLANRLLAHKRRSRGYIAAGWIKAAQVFGAANGRKVSERGRAGQGYGRKAFDTRLEAVGANLATGADIVGRNALQAALDFVGRDMTAYAEREMAKVWR